MYIKVLQNVQGTIHDQNNNITLHVWLEAYLVVTALGQPNKLRVIKYNDNIITIVINNNDNRINV